MGREQEALPGMTDSTINRHIRGLGWEDKHPPNAWLPGAKCMASGSHEEFSPNPTSDHLSLVSKMSAWHWAGWRLGKQGAVKSQQQGPEPVEIVRAVRHRRAGGTHLSPS